MSVSLDFIKFFNDYIFKRITFDQYVENFRRLKHWIVEQNFTEITLQKLFNYIYILENKGFYSQQDPNRIIQLWVNILLILREYEIINQGYYIR